MRCILLLALFATVPACDGPAAPSDASATGDTPTVDGGDDAPYLRPDGGPTGAPLVPTDPCDDLVADLYTTSIPPFDEAARGAVLGCAFVEEIDAASVGARLPADFERVPTGVRIYVIVYRTEREPRGVSGVATALVMLPTVARSERVPLVLLAHGTVGIADACAPSRFVREGLDVIGLPASYVDPLLFAHAARGLPVVAPDYAGLGTEGVHAYDSWLDPARSAIDGVRALRSLLPSDRLDGRTLVYGHSQGGGVALAVAGLLAEAPDLDVAAIVAAAPGYRFSQVLTALGLSTFPLDAPLRGFSSMAVVSAFANLTEDQTRWGDAFRPALRSRIVDVLTTSCVVDAITALDVADGSYVPPTTIGELVDPAFAEEVSSCRSGGTCDPLVGAFIARDVANEPRTRATSPPILILGSNEDLTSLPRFVGCVVDRVQADGASPEVCMLDAGDHLAMVPATIGHAIDWSLAAASAEPRPPCPGSPEQPRCRLF